jgi:hypothetical protein
LPHLRGLGVQERGMPDNLYIRYCKQSQPFQKSWAEVAWIEWKKKGGKAEQLQKDWHAKERSRGALTLIAGEDFPASIAGFCSWYAKSGLQRKQISIPR